MSTPHSWSVSTSRRLLGRLTAPEVASEVRAESVLCLPVGAFEQHGPHLPIHTDVVLAEGFAREVITRWGDDYDVWLLPTIPFGISSEHAWSQGTVSLSIRTFSDVVLAACEAIAAATAAKNLLIINGHGGNRGVLETLVYEIEQRSSVRACVTHPTALSRVRSGSSLPEIHGGMSETSVMLALAPEEVHLERLPDSFNPAESVGEAIRAAILDRGVSWPWSSDDRTIASNGVIGDPRQATVELGRHIVASAVDEYGRVLSRLIARGTGDGRQDIGV